MPTGRSYRDACGIARALDVVGERWALLIVRELIFGPRRFTDLRRGLPGASSNLVAARLRELEAGGVIRRRWLPPPAGSWVYELTEWGRELEPIVVALGNWGIRVPLPPAPVHLSGVSVLLYLRAAARLEPDVPAATYRVELDDQVWTVRATAGRVSVESGEPGTADASLRTDPVTLNTLLGAPGALAAAVADKRITVAGEMSAIRRLLGAVPGQPAARPDPGAPAMPDGPDPDSPAMPDGPEPGAPAMPDGPDPDPPAMPDGPDPGPPAGPAVPDPGASAAVRST